MSKWQGIFAALAFVAASISGNVALAFTPSGADTTITNVVGFQDTVTDVIIQTASGYTCYFNINTASGKQLLSIVYGYFLSGRTVKLYCDDATSTVQAFPNAHRLHRIGS